MSGSKYVGKGDINSELLNMEWSDAAAKYGGDYSEFTQAELKKEWKQCEVSPYF